MNILVIGSGAIGGFYGSLLARGGCQVSVLARADYRRIRDHGIQVESPLGDHHFQPRQVITETGQLQDVPDYVLLCVKVVEGIDRIALLRGALAPASTIVLLCNGIGIEDEIAAAYPQHELISGLAFVCVTRTAPGHIRHQAYGRLVFGNYLAAAGERVGKLCRAFEAAGVECRAAADIITARWEKCVWNAPFNPLSVLSGGLPTSLILATQEPLVRAIMEEICKVAAVSGHTLPPDVIDRNLDSTRTMPPYKTSMLLDFEAGRPLETEAILGNAVRWARRLGVPIPCLESIYGLMQLREAARMQTTREPP